ncbi:MAG: class I SAM-dependent methyltransferase, partial [Candidatus Bathyarchaeota archaeon]
MSSEFTRMVNGFFKIVNNLDFDSKTVADFGCGFGRWGHIIRSEAGSGGNNAFVVGCDAFRPSLQQAKKYSPYDELVVCDIRQPPFKENAFDITIAC